MKLTTCQQNRIYTPDRTLPRHGNAKTNRIDLGIALLHAIAEPGVCYTLDEIAVWAGCTNQTILNIERKALRKVRAALGE